MYPYPPQRRQDWIWSAPQALLATSPVVVRRGALITRINLVPRRQDWIWSSPDSLLYPPSGFIASSYYYRNVAAMGGMAGAP